MPAGAFAASRPTCRHLSKSHSGRAPAWGSANLLRFCRRGRGSRDFADGRARANKTVGQKIFRTMSCGIVRLRIGGAIFRLKAEATQSPLLPPEGGRHAVVRFFRLKAEA